MSVAARIRAISALVGRRENVPMSDMGAVFAPSKVMPKSAASFSAENKSENTPMDPVMLSASA